MSILQRIELQAYDNQQAHLEIIELDKDVLKFGSNSDQVDIILNSRLYSQIISGDHAEIRRTRAADGSFFFYLVDKSLNGTYINEHRAVRGPVLIQANDIIKFGHVNGAAIAPGQHAPQRQAEFTFMVDMTFEFKGGGRPGSTASIGLWYYQYRIARSLQSNRYFTSFAFAQVHPAIYNAVFFPTDQQEQQRLLPVDSHFHLTRELNARNYKWQLCSVDHTTATDSKLYYEAVGHSALWDTALTLANSHYSNGPLVWNYRGESAFTKEDAIKNVRRLLVHERIDIHTLKTWDM